MTTTPKRFDELALGDIVTETMWNGQTVRREYLGDGTFRDLATGRVDVDGADAWDDYDVEGTLDAAASLLVESHGATTMDEARAIIRGQVTA